MDKRIVLIALVGLIVLIVIGFPSAVIRTFQMAL